MNRWVVAIASTLLEFTIASAAYPAAGVENAVPPTPAPIKGILAARRFTLDTPFPYTWSQERILVKTGVLVVLEVDPAYVVPRDALEPVLYAGSVPVQRLNHGNLSGRVIGIVPGNVNLAATPIWFGTPQLPERVTASVVESEQTLAKKAGVRLIQGGSMAGITRPPVPAKDLAALLRDLGSQLVLRYSPQEKELAESWRLPVAMAPAKKRSN